MNRTLGWLACLAAACIVPVSGCSAPRPPDSSGASTHSPLSAPTDLRNVVLPDLSAMAPSVQRQLRDQFDVLERSRQDATMPADQRAAAYGDMGKLFLAAESYTEAEACFLDAGALAPADARWIYYVAQVYRLQGESQKAASFFERALRAKPDDVATLVWLGDVYLDQGRPMDARPLFARAIAIDPRAAAAKVGLGRVALAAHDYAGAVAQLEGGLALDRSASSIQYLLATAYRGAGKIERADAHLRQRGAVPVLPPDPLMQDAYDRLRSPTLYEARGDRALARGDSARAVALFRSGLDLAPDSLTLRQKLATALFLTDDVQGSVKELQEILRRSPTFASAHYSLGVLLLGSGQPDLAIERFASAVRYDPSYTQARLQLANTLRQRGKFALARDQYGLVMKQDPRVAEARFGLAAALVGLKRYEEARDRFSEGLQLYPDRAEFRSALVRLYAAAPEPRVRDGARALALAEDLVKRSDTVPSREAMAMALAESGRYEAAIRWQREAIAAAARAGQAELSRRMGDNLKLYEQQRPCRVPWREEPMWES